MKPDEYIEKAHRTAPEKYRFPDTDDITARLEHAVMGVVTEAGELMDHIKKTKIYNQTLDKSGILGEAGDVMWYLALLVKELDSSFEEIWDKNIRKLQKRYPEKFTEENAKRENRNLDREREELEN